MKFTHIDDTGGAYMVDVGNKENTEREAVAQAIVTMKPETITLITSSEIPKGDVFSCARIAGIMAAKRNHELIPMCHPIPLDGVKVSLEVKDCNQVYILATINCYYHTGVEMEALTAASVAALTVYDMCKSVDKGMIISDITLLRKTGGKSGTYIREKM